jgi:hypothetical protein
MSRAILDGRKTQTRRPAFRENATPAMRRTGTNRTPWQRVQVGDLLYVRERWRVGKRYDAAKPAELPHKSVSVIFEAGGSLAVQPSGEYEPDMEWPRGDEDWFGRWRPAMFLPRWASRTTLEVTAVRIEPVQAITDEDALAEGMSPAYLGDGDPPFEECATMVHPAQQFRNLWLTIHGPGSWTLNPEVVAITFKVHKQNIDTFKEERGHHGKGKA